MPIFFIVQSYNPYHAYQGLSLLHKSWLSELLLQLREREKGGAEGGE